MRSVCKILISAMAILSISRAAAQTKDSVAYRLLVKFQSECCGVPDAAPLCNGIMSFKKKYKIKTITAQHIGPMGREGEYYLAFDLKEMNKKQALDFTEKIKSLTKKLKKPGNAIVEENVQLEKVNFPGRATVKETIF